MSPVAMRMLVSVRSVDEALDAAEGGADFIDLKEPRDGALGGLPLATIRAVVEALRQRLPRLPISATIGDLPMHAVAPILDCVEAVGACGVDYVKVGIERDGGAAGVIDALAACGRPVVPVFIADRGLDDALVARACAARSLSKCAFPAIMVDTADKQAGSLLDVLSTEALQRFIDAVRGAGALVGVAGALRASDIETLAAWRPDFAGFRSAVCGGDRASRLDADRVHALSLRLRAASGLPLPA
jgi:uncharacterized protein (UPF0264 family)